MAAVAVELEGLAALVAVRAVAVADVGEVAVQPTTLWLTDSERDRTQWMRACKKSWTRRSCTILPRRRTRKRMSGR